MSKVLIISGHPDISHSTANRIILEEVVTMNRVVAIDIMKNYPGGEVDIKADQRMLLDAGLIIFQFPFIWYGLASHVKRWIENVFSYGFAFGPGGIS